MVDTQIITLDGPSGCGKSTVTLAVAQKLGFHWLNSGALYRLVALEHTKNPSQDIQATLDIIQNADIEFTADTTHLVSHIFYNRQDVTSALQAPDIAQIASKLAQHSEVRSGLLGLQQKFLKSPGLVAEGRDMGTFIFPQATLKCYLTATPEIRALRRQKQLLEINKHVSLDTLISSINQRDQRDCSRAEAPLKPADDAMIIDTSEMSLSAVSAQVIQYFKIKAA
jgi:CMP/dCMP kinase